MAEEITTKKVENLSENTEPADTDTYLFGASGTNVIKKIKWSNILAKLKSILFANNLTTTQEGYGLDARQGKALKDEIDQLNTNIRYLKKFEYSPITLQANVTKSIALMMEVDSRLFGKMDSEEKENLKAELDELEKIVKSFQKLLTR